MVQREPRHIRSGDGNGKTENIVIVIVIATRAFVISDRGVGGNLSDASRLP
ncbi:hypothetical protein C8J36_107178 [Rhizobium sp. PP-F2F-G48]|uniref:hypothetical protein n=1 Tax=Rhizobium sp. PP-F2F-G48 TaxID=2135651 RepID=UPI0010EE1D8F|nr:hypothetical protein [Rhizobium sp. PP-F2F-G48]TCM53215.1 hypothetical protein C8J36_107178 [Rhizobium sp. PP-F2F-G48]